MPIAPDSTVELTFRGRCFGQEVIMRLGYVCTVGNGALSDAALAFEFLSEVSGAGANAITTSYLACMPPQYSLERLTYQEVFPVRKALQDLSFGPPLVGTNANAATVACDAAAITRRTALAGKSQRSVLKIGPTPDGASAAGLFTNAYLALLGALALDTRKLLILPASTTQFLGCILNRTTRASNGRILVAQRVGLSSRVSNRRVVGIGS